MNDIEKQQLLVFNKQDNTPIDNNTPYIIRWL